MGAKVILRTTAGPLNGQTFSFDSHDTFLFGRAEDCHARLAENDRTASRHHFLLEVSPPAARLRDLGSLNGTYVNARKYGARGAAETPEEAARKQYPQVDLKHGDEIRVGESVFTLEVQGAPAATEVSLCAECGGPSPCSRCQPEAPAKSIAKAEMKSGYELGRQLGEGGMGAVYQARRLSDGAQVAVKVMLSQVAVHAAARDRFLREIAILSKLRHPRCVELLDCGVSQNTFFFVMELCPGGSLDALGILPLDRLAPLLDEALEGLVYAHGAGFVHRDLKPQNVLLERRGGGAKLADFGLAKSFEQAGFSGFTATGGFAGTTRYMAREQITNYKYVKPATDVWSLAATAYMVLTGQFPREFPDGRDPVEVILRQSPTPIRHHLPSLPARVAEVLDRALADKLSERYLDASEFRRAWREAFR